MRFLLVTGTLLAALTLSACQTMTPEQRRAADEAKCATYGFRTGSEAMARCLLDIDLDRRAEARSFAERNADFMWYRQPVIIERQVVVERKQ